jgi:hypothetical protein
MAAVGVEELWHIVPEYFFQLMAVSGDELKRACRMLIDKA